MYNKVMTALCNSVFHFGRFIQRTGGFFQDLSVFLHIKLKTPTGVKILVAIEQTKQIVEAMKQQSQQGANKHDKFRSLLGQNRPGNS